MQELKILIKKLIDKLDLFYNKNNITKECQDVKNNMKLQKLVFYAYADYLVKHNKEISIENQDNIDKLFNSSIEAWPYGPVIPALYFKFNVFGSRVLNLLKNKKNLKHLNDKQTQSIDYILDLYGHCSGIELSRKTHDEDPWWNSFESRYLCDSSLNQIKDKLIFQYYNENKLKSLDDKYKDENQNHGEENNLID